MQTNIETLENCKTIITLKSESADWKSKIEKAYNKLESKISLPGFRKGKAPKELLRSKVSQEDVFNEALNNITPQLEVKARRIGGANYQVPVEVRADRKMTLCLRWLTQYSRLRKEKTMEERLANEIMDAANGIGGSVKKRDDTHRMAESNKAFAHYQW